MQVLQRWQRPQYHTKVLDRELYWEALLTSMDTYHCIWEVPRKGGKCCLVLEGDGPKDYVMHRTMDG